MKKMIALLLLIFNGLLFAQNDRFIYELKYKRDSVSAEITKENYYLDITKDDVAYYNRLYYIRDSIFTATGMHGFQGFKLTSFLTKKLNSSLYENYEYIGDVNFYKIEEPVHLDWKISNDTKMINELKVQKAEIYFGGRNWTAWFTPEIPLSYGPYKFNGLPGLITEMYDDKKNYIFKLVKSEKIPENYESYNVKEFRKGAIPTNYKKLSTLKLELYKDPFKYVFNGKLSIPEGKKLLLDDGTILSKDELKPAEKREREKIRSFNNPIELDKAVKYPN
ncbi:GLPGLI family protein [Chryseobacterium lactis]|uniref:GLPGLI family protein n=1 Tax=Chryseobacterium lactis TaxID=1241981 RepID=A0A3G6RTA6_CHRLC|nr:GLPGLI family protein [Chryseobacterium lactis]AZA82015.1 GLPGLI family protein [Chryseobacterium lactis]AZB07013.1 GLPGLI family protein [Chryseobacterium lactis]PNW11040.1 GLPGLI family protein [Chryseobacterium lactis]